MTDVLRKLVRAEPSIKALSEATGVHRQSLALFRDGRQSLRLDKADALAAHFGVTINHPKRSDTA